MQKIIERVVNNMKNEMWKDIKGYEGYYQVSNQSTVKSLDRYANWKYNQKQSIKGKILSINQYPNGYSYVSFSVNGKRRTQLLHRLVAQAFILNIENKPEVNHKDEDITNNKINNLEWMTSKENANYGTRNMKVAEKNGIHVVQLSKDLELIKIHSSIANASREIGITDSPIVRVCKGTQKTAKGFKWMYYSDYIAQKVS